MDSDSGLNGHRFLDCPSEIISSILLFCSAGDHFCLSRVSKRLNKEANRFLYSTVRFRWTVEQVTPTVVLFLRTILNAPHLSLMVESLQLIGDTHRWRSSAPKLSWSGAGSTLHLAVSLVTELQLPCTEDWIRGLQECSMDVAIALLFTQLPNMRSFVTTYNFTREVSLQGAVFRSISCRRRRSGSQQSQVGRLPHFDKLHHVSAKFHQSHHRRRDPNTDTLLSFFYLPQIQTLDLVLDNPVRFSWPVATPPTPETLTSLTLRNVRETALKRILSATKRLVKLDWEFLYSEGNMSSQLTHTLLYPPIVDLDYLVDALTPIRETLKDLTIRADATEPIQMDYESLIEIRGSLKGLVEFKVRRLQVPLPFLAGQLLPNNRFRISERLPRDLRTLVISRDLEEFNGWMLDEGDWDRDEIALNLLDWLCKDIGATPFLEVLDLGLMTGNMEDSFYWAVKKQMDKEQVPIRLTLGEVSQ